MKFTKKILDNGLTILHEQRDVPVTTVMLATKFGAINEDEEEKGIAHFMEHMAFKGTKKRNAFQIASEVESVGGNLNAFTEEEVTAYHVKLPSGHLNRAMDILFDIFFNPIYPPEEMEKESNVICEEIKMYEDDPKMNVLEGIKACLYKKPFGMSIAGTQESVMSISRADMLKKHAQYYIPSNSILAVVGNNSFEEVLELAEKLCPAGGGKVTSAVRVELQNSKLAKKRADLQQTNLCIGFHLPTDLKYAIDVFISILGEGMSSKLFTEVREKRGLVYGIKAYQQVTNNFGYAVIFAGTEPSKAEEVIKISLEQFHKMKDISESELESAKNQVIGNFEVGFEDSSNVALSLVDEEIQGKAEDFYEYQKNIKKVSLEDIRKIASITEYSTYLLG